MNRRGSPVDRHWFRTAAFLGGFALASTASAQGPVDPKAPLPPGHVPVTAAAPAARPGTAPAAAEPESDDEETADTPSAPPGHGAAAPAQPPQDRAVAAPDLRPGTIEVLIHDGNSAPIPRLPLRLGVLHSDVAQGDSKSQIEGTTDERGVAVFRGLEVGTAFSYRVTVPRGPATFAADPVRLDPSGGQRVLLHVYPIVRDIREALVGMRGVLFVQPRDDVFHIEANFQVLNIGAVAWVPENVRLVLPEGAKAFRPADEMSDTRVEKTASGDLRIVGTFSPGEHEVGFQFQLDNPHDRSKSLHIALPPHVAELRVVAEGARGMELHVPSFPDAEPMQGQDGSHLLVTGKHLVRGESSLDSVSITLENLPVPSSGRWYAVGIALMIAGFGLFQMVSQRPSPARKLARQGEAEEAEDLVLRELVELERLRKSDRVGPRTYEETRAELLDALARLDSRTPAEPA
ncbi:MAG TPA: hypothetical protein VF395_20220 [Polyangiaceae bacterium]